MSTYKIDNLKITTKNKTVVGNFREERTVAVNFLATPVTAVTTDILELKHTGLTIGRSYRLFIQASMTLANQSARLTVNHNGATVGNLMGSCPTESGLDRYIGASTFEFVASSTSVTFAFAEFATATLDAGVGRAGTYTTIQELPYDIVEGGSL